MSRAILGRPSIHARREFDRHSHISQPGDRRAFRMTGATEIDPRLADMRAAWAAKRGIRAIYEDYYRHMARAIADGPTLEIGGGFGNLKAFFGDSLSMDVLYAPGLDLMADAHDLPFPDGAFANIAFVDVLHHLSRPIAFLQEAARVLRPGGRIVMIEPAITPLSAIFYHWLHPEPVDMRADPFGTQPSSSPDDAFDSNQAIPTLLFRRRQADLAVAVEDLSIVETRWLSLFAYPLTGGYRPWCLIPTPLIRPVLAAEEALMPLLGRLAAFRLFVTLERR